MNEDRRMLRYGMAGAIGGAGMVAPLLLATAFLGLSPESATELGWQTRSRPSAIGAAWLVGGVVGGLLWGAFQPLTERLVGAVGAAFVTALPVLILLRFVANPEPFTLDDVAGVVTRATGWAAVVGTGWLVRRIRVVGAAQSDGSQGAVVGTEITEPEPDGRGRPA